MKRKANREKPRKRRSVRRRGKGTLLILACLLIGSAVLRIGADAGQAIARTEEPENQADMAAHAPVPQACEPEPDVAAMLAAFATREARLKEKEAQVANRMQALSVADQEIEKKLAELTRAEEALRETLALADTAAEDDLSRLTAVYENMKPKEAAMLFEEMDPQFAAGFLGRMQPGAAAGVMAGLSPQTAYAVSVILAGRNANVPTE